MENEVWKYIEDYTDYQVSTMGLVKSLKAGREKILKVIINASGYQVVGLCDGKAKMHLVHRLVAIAFIPNPENKRTVNHKKGIRSDNRKSELEWATYSENHLHSYRELGRKSQNHMLGKFGKDHHSSKPISQYSKEGDFINTFGSQHEAERITGIDNSSISSACSGRNKSAGGYIWKFDNNK
jgi:hypothetical protein